ncbi:hypothetical protein [Nonomuraea sp. NPDC049784]|uniref:hypothetical protein n=1 Tax=Nonomuraea sp. NPDC049784 TaxID=3154361 RepID=UPI0033D8ADA8
MFTRREFMRLAAAAAGAGVCEAGTTTARGLRKYVDRLPRVPVAVPDTSVYPDADYYEVTMRQQPWRFHADLGETVAWGYWASDPSGQGRPAGLGCLGPALVARRYRPSVVRYRNHLPTTHLLRGAIDESLWRQLPGVSPDPPGGRHMDMPSGVTVWNVVHLHGGWDPPQSDGNPAAWFTPQGMHGPLYASLPGAAPNEAIFAYCNRQQATMLWYHDHAMQLTRAQQLRRPVRGVRDPGSGRGGARPASGTLRGPPDRPGPYLQPGRVPLGLAVVLGKFPTDLPDLY